MSAKECSNYHTIVFIPHTSKVLIKILQARLQQYVNQEIPDVQAGFRKGRGTRDSYSQSYGFSSSHVWMLELDHKENLSAKGFMLLNCGVGEDSWESLEQKGDQTSQS